MFEKAKKLSRWSTIKMYMQEKFSINQNNYKRWFTPRGSIYTCHFGENIGDEKCGIGRTVLIVSSDKINRKSTNVIVVTLSTTIKWKDKNKKDELAYDTHWVLYKRKYPKLRDDSAVQCEDIKVVSKARLGQFVCLVDNETDMKQIKKRLKSTLQI